MKHCQILHKYLWYWDDLLWIYLKQLKLVMKQSISYSLITMINTGVVYSLSNISILFCKKDICGNSFLFCQSIPFDPVWTLLAILFDKSFSQNATSSDIFEKANYLAFFCRTSHIKWLIYWNIASVAILITFLNPDLLNDCQQ